jgi:DedD protein
MRSIIEEEEKESTDTEITLGMKSLLGVFFGAVLVCGVFFGFGYSLGRGSAHPGPAGAKDTAAPAVAVAPSGDQDSMQASNRQSTSDSMPNSPPAPLKTIVSDDTTPGSNPPASQSASAKPDKQYEYIPTPDGPARRPIDAPPRPRNTAATPAIAKPSAAIVSPPPAQTAESIPAPAPKAESATLAAPRGAAPPSAQPVSESTTSASASTMVQIAAVTHQEDANILVGALRKRGYVVVVRNDPKDSLLHVQLGPFSSRDEARAMRARLLGDGYNAILK